MNFAEGLRRIFILIGLLVAAAIFTIGYTVRPTLEGANHSAARDLLEEVAEKFPGMSGWQVRAKWMYGRSDAAVVQTLCGWYKHEPAIKRRCDAHKAEIDGKPWEITKFFRDLLFYAAAGFSASLLCC